MLLFFIFGKNTTEMMPCPSQSITSGDIYQYVLSGHADFEHLLKVVSTGFLHCFIFPFVTNKYFVKRYFETTQIFCFSSYLCSIILAFIRGSCL